VDLILSLLLLPLGGLGLAYLLARDTLGEGQSFGKRLYGLKVVGAEGGDPCSLSASLQRNLPLLVPLVPMIEVILLSTTGLRLGDRSARTRVVFQDDPPATALLASTTLAALSTFSLFVVVILYIAGKGY
jgi:uncharacterized RDD family membrane protein YckC